LFVVCPREEGPDETVLHGQLEERSVEPAPGAKAPGPIGRRRRDVVMPAIRRRTADSKANRQVYDHYITWDEQVPRDSGSPVR
jgi:hypothetical protein